MDHCGKLFLGNLAVASEIINIKKHLQLFVNSPAFKYGEPRDEFWKKLEEFLTSRD
jgi:hypothetical protein